MAVVPQTSSSLSLISHHSQQTRATKFSFFSFLFYHSLKKKNQEYISLFFYANPLSLDFLQFCLLTIARALQH